MAFRDFCLHFLLFVSCSAFRCTATDSQASFQLKHHETISDFGDVSFDKLVEEIIDALHVPGLSVAVINDGNISSKGYGISNFPSTNATGDTLYFAASTTKAFTAAAAAALIQDQDAHPSLKWNTPLSSLIRDDFVLPDDYSTSHITIEDALSHRSGMPRHDLSYSPNDTPKSITRRMRHLPLTQAPRTTFQYCNTMYAAVTDILETLTGIKLEQIFEEKFWKPLGMKSTSFYKPDSLKSLARGYWYDESQSQYVPESHLNMSSISGAGGIVSSVNNYALWIKAWLEAADSNSNSSSPITRDIYKSLLSPRTIVSKVPGAPIASPESNAFISPPFYALGWFTASVIGHTVVQHSGGLPGFGTQVLFLPDDGWGVVTMGNTALTSNYAGAYITSILLQKKLRIRSQDQELFNIALDEVLQVSESLSTQICPLPKENCIKLASHYGVADKLPLPGNIDDYAGVYTNPGYGSLNLSISPTPFPSPLDSTSPPPLTGVFVPERMWRYKLELHYDTDTLFEVRLFVGHGIDEDHTVWQQGGNSRAVFKFGLPGEGGAMEVETLGIELEIEMVEATREADENGKRWKDGMIWFEKT